MNDLSKLVFDTANSLNKTYLEGMNQGQRMEVKKMELQELLDRSVSLADDTGQFQEKLIKAIKDMLKVRSANGLAQKHQKSDWEDFLNGLKFEAGQDSEEVE